MRDFMKIVEASWDTENWWEPKLDGETAVHGPGDHHPDGVYARFGVPEEVENRYSIGQCTYLAYAMNERFGWPIRAEFMRETGDIAHAFCVMPDGREVDILGPQEKVDSFEGGEVRELSPRELWDSYISREKRSPEEITDHLNDARKAVEMFIVPKVQA